MNRAGIALTVAAVAALGGGCVAPLGSLPARLSDRLSEPLPEHTTGAGDAEGAPGLGRASEPERASSADAALRDTSYAVDVRLQPGHRRMLATVRIVVRNVSGGPVGRITLRSYEKVPLRVQAARVDGQPASARVQPGRIVVDLDGPLADRGTVTLRLDLVLPLGRRITGLGYFHAWRSGVVQVAEWLPRLDPGLSRRIEVEIHAPKGMVVAHGSVEHARELPIVASRRYRRLQTSVGRTRITMLYEPGGARRATALATLGEVRRALPWIERRLGLQPRTRITIAQINSTDLAYAWPGVIWLPDNLSRDGVRGYVAHELAHQWFGGVVPTRSRAREPFTGEGPAELVSRLFRHALRASACPGRRLDLPRSAYGACFYEAIYVDGANVLNQVRLRMGGPAFWRALRGYLQEHRFQPVELRDLIQALRRASRVDLDPLLRSRFPSIVR